jgi:DNA topoisomerase VI subunit B
LQPRFEAASEYAKLQAEALMAKSKKPNTQITQGGIKITGNVSIKDSKIAGRDNIEKNVFNVNVSFAPVYNAIQENANIPTDVKENLTENVKQLEQEINKGEKAEPSFIQKRMETIQKMAPEIAEVVVATLQNPAAGIGLVVKKVIDKFNVEKKN